MSKPKLTVAALALVGGLALSGCGSSPGGSSSGSGATTGAGQAATSGPVAGSTSDVSGAPLQARMVCGGQVARNLRELEGMTGAIPATFTWANEIFTCNYTLNDGPLVLAVKKSANNGAAKAYFDAAQQTAGGTTMPSFAALGIAAYSTPRGTVSFVKDDMTLLVDATKLPDSVGPSATTRNQFASTVASFVLACWRQHSG